MIYVITGATGNIGGLVVEQLLGRGERPRVFVRDREKALARFGEHVDIFIGDLSSMAGLELALEGADVLFLANSGPDLGARDGMAAKLGKTAGVKQLVKLSSYDARELVGTGIWHAQGESAIRGHGIPFTFVRPSGFMSNALFWAQSIQEEGVVRACTHDGRIPFIHPRDIAGVATKALISGKFLGESLTITGPEPLSYAEMAVKIGGVIGKAVRFEPISDAELRSTMVDAGDPEDVIEAHLSIYGAIRAGRLAETTDTVERVLGRAPITFDEWVRENMNVFAVPVLH